MEKLKVNLPARPGSPGSPRSVATARATKTYRIDNLPTISNRLTDVEIPRRVWSHWIPDFGERQLVRALEPEERVEIERRRDELAPAVAPYPKTDRDRVLIAIADMFGSYTSMRQVGDDAMAKVDAVARALAEFPAWAIEKACAAIQRNGVWRETRFDRQWPPNDSEIIEAVRVARCLIGDQHDGAVALLNATVEK